MLYVLGTKWQISCNNNNNNNNNNNLFYFSFIFFYFFFNFCLLLLLLLSLLLLLLFFFTHMVIPFKFRLCAQVTLCTLCRFIILCIQIVLLQP